MLFKVVSTQFNLELESILQHETKHKYLSNIVLASIAM